MWLGALTGHIWTTELIIDSQLFDGCIISELTLQSYIFTFSQFSSSARTAFWKCFVLKWENWLSKRVFYCESCINVLFSFFFFLHLQVFSAYYLWRQFTCHKYKFRTKKVFTDNNYLVYFAQSVKKGRRELY